MPLTTLRATYDARVRESLSTSNFGEERYITVKNSGAGDQQYSFVAFPGLPEIGATVVSATLRLFLKGTAWSGSDDLRTLRVIESWKESTITWANKPDTGGTAVSVTVVNGVEGQAVDLVVTSLVADVLTGGQEFFGFRLATNSGSAERKIFSSEATDPALRPLLLVEWSSVPEAPADMAPSGQKKVSVLKPTFTWNFRDPDGDEQTAFQVLIDDASTVDGNGKLASPEYDSGWITSNAEEFESALSGTGGAIPTFNAAGTAASGTGDVTPGLPAGTLVNDWLLLTIASEATDPPPAAPDETWLSLAPSVVAGGSRLTCFHKFATAAEVAPTVLDVGNHLGARIVGFRGTALTGNPFEFVVTSSEAVSDTSGSITGGTTTSANDLIVLVAASDFDVSADDTAGYSAQTNAALGSLTERTDNRFAAGTGSTLSVTTGTKATAGAVGATTYTLANAANKTHYCIALQPTGSYGGTWAGISDGNVRFWQVRTRDEQGQDSPWSAVNEFGRTSKGALTVTSPADAGTVEETTPPIITSLATRSQVAISYTLEQRVTADLEWVEVWSQRKRAALTTPGSSYTFSVPSGYITLAATNYRLTVRSWDDVDRVATPGDPQYVQGQSTFTFARSATPSAVTVLTAAQESNSGPGVTLTWNRGAGVAAPDYFALVVDGERVLDRIDPNLVIVGGDPIVFSMVWYGAAPYGQSTYEVEAVTNVSGVLKHSQSNDTENFTSRPVGTWLVDDNDAPYKPSAPPRRIRLHGTGAPSLGIAQSGATFHPVGRRDPVQVVDAIGGYEGSVSGSINEADTAQTGVNSIANLQWAKRPRNVGRRWRLVQGGLNIPVELGTLETFAPTAETGPVRAYDVSIEVFQVGEFKEA